jgi:hypothetical protein
MVLSACLIGLEDPWGAGLIIVNEKNRGLRVCCVLAAGPLRDELLAG